MLWIFGCQRSGTTLLGRVIEKDFRALVLHEDSQLTGSAGHRLRLKPLDELQRVIHNMRYPFIVAKPLVESQRASEILEQFPTSCALWMYRNYRDVINSHVHRFEAQVEHLRSIMNDDENNWRSQNISPEVRSVISNFYSESISRENAAALIWFARNMLFFEQGLDSDPRVQSLDYYEFVTQPDSSLEKIYRLAEIDLPDNRIASVVDAKSLGHGRNIELDPEIEELCQDLSGRLATYSEAQSH